MLDVSCPYSFRFHFFHSAIAVVTLNSLFGLIYFLVCAAVYSVHYRI